MDSNTDYLQELQELEDAADGCFSAPAEYFDEDKAKAREQVLAQQVEDVNKQS